MWVDFDPSDEDVYGGFSSISYDVTYEAENNEERRRKIGSGSHPLEVGFILDAKLKNTSTASFEHSLS